ncbi:MAG: 16S rRNA (uracil(1498)-N(3))-methyltransferase [Treponema sp.]|jgi:16S rRNA (uracil1498-N3)-methyltransferase|nr:16S rRNA (uracil(1498)-N(3))-methyltransferase [Treponema sp.]
MKQFLLSAPPDADGFVRIEGEDYHYLVRVRRLRAGDSFPALLPAGGADPGRKALVRVLSADRGLLTGRCQPLEDAASAKEVLRESPGELSGPAEPPVLLFQALPKGTKMDLIVRQAAEMGIAGVVPFAAERSVAKLPDSGGKLERWERIIREARQQSGSVTPTFLRSPLSLEGLFSYWETLKGPYSRPLGILFHQDPVIPLAKFILHDYLNEGPDIVALVIGPEGGFSPGEVSRFLEAGFRPFKIGDTVLRTETAALCGAAAVRVILLENTSWIHQPR